MSFPDRIRTEYDNIHDGLAQPRVRLRWLVAASWRLAFLLTFAGLLAIFLMPQLVDVLATWLSPPQPEKRLFGLITDWHPNPWRPWTELLLWGLFVARVLYSAIGILWSTRPTRTELNALAPKDAEQTQVNPRAPAAGAPAPSSNSDARYRIDAELGRGAMGIVYRAEDTRLRRTVALKVLAPHVAQDDALRARFLREAQAIARLSHRGIVQVYDFSDGAEGCSIAMEFVAGPSLAKLAGKQPQSLADVLRWGRVIAEALACAHEQNVIHRDLKPANVLMTEQTWPKITDFGLARINDSTSHAATLTGTVMGSPAYMSPEQAAGQHTDARSDIYALGILLYELLAGQPPFTGDGSQVMAAQVTRPPDDIRARRHDVPEALAALVMQLLAKAPAERPASMREVANRLAMML